MFDKKPGLARPEDFRVWEDLELIYEGKLVDYREFLRSKEMSQKSDKQVSVG